MIKLVKLVTGEEILTKIVENNSEHLVIDNPVKLALSQKGVAMIPLSPFMKENTKITFSHRDVLYIIEADDDVVNAYNSQFGGIVMASPSLTLG